MGIGADRITDETQLAFVCQELLADWPEAQAAVLFGSRARGDHHPDSDWDVAVIVEGNDDISGSDRFDRFGLNDVDVQTVSLDWALEDFDCINHLPCALALDGRLLAGEWDFRKPQSIHMETKTWERYMLTALSHIEHAMDQFGKVAMWSEWSMCLSDCTIFVKATADAAEFLVKAMIGRRGIRSDFSHDITKLVDGYVEAREPKWRKMLVEDQAAEVAEDRSLAERMKALNSFSRDHQQGHYSLDWKSRPTAEMVLAPDSVAAAINRLVALPEMWLSEMTANPDDGAMSVEIPFLLKNLAERSGNWLETLDRPIRNKRPEQSLAQKASEAILARREQVRTAVLEVQAQLEGLV